MNERLKCCSFFFTAESSRKSALINWYLNEISDEIETEQELTEKKMLIERVINRLIYQVSYRPIFGILKEKAEKKPVLKIVGNQTVFNKQLIWKKN